MSSLTLQKRKRFSTEDLAMLKGGSAKRFHPFRMGRGWTSFTLSQGGYAKSSCLKGGMQKVPRPAICPFYSPTLLPLINDRSLMKSSPKKTITTVLNVTFY